MATNTKGLESERLCYRSSRGEDSGRSVLRESERRVAGKLERSSRQPHPGTQVHCYRCSLPGLAGFAAYRCGGTDGSTITRFGHGSRETSAHCGECPRLLQENSGAWAFI